MSQAQAGELRLPSNRSFGWTFAALFTLLGAFAHPWMLPLAAAVAGITLTRAHWLTPFNRAWMKLGAAMHAAVSPVVMGVMFFGVFTPMGWAMRRCGWDAMKRAWDPQAKSYWTRREPAGPANDSFRNLF
jgi:hypothetical protein